jgi:hypothetical protein
VFSYILPNFTENVSYTCHAWKLVCLN